MRKTYLYLIVICFVITLALIALYITPKTCYLNLSFYNIATKVNSEGEAVYIQTTPSYMELIGVSLNDGENDVKVTDKQVINLVIDYLNNLPLVSVNGYFDKSKKVFVIKELYEQGYDFIKGNKEKDVLLRFYNDNQNEIGNIKIYNEKYICDPNYRAYKVEDDVVSIVSDLRRLLQEYSPPTH
ncbi:MAG: hypothetical protein IKW60_00735 [Clostridia bacterium]|nr:hypothetical protein [Clostridia bacterium]